MSSKKSEQDVLAWETITQLIKRLRNFDFTGKDFKSLGDIPLDILGVLRGTHKIVFAGSFACDINPLLIANDGKKNFEVKDHKKRKPIGFDKINDIRLLVLDRQREQFGASGMSVYEEIRVMQGLLNINVMALLLVNQHLIPRKWRGNKNIFFWGTVFQRDGILFVPYMRWRQQKGTWEWDVCSLDKTLDDSDYAAMLS